MSQGPSRLAPRRRPRAQRRGVACFECWSNDLGATESVSGLLRLLGDVYGVPSVHRDAATWPELSYYLDSWLHFRRNASVGYFAFHGTDGGFQLAGQYVTLDEFGEKLRGSCAGRTLLFTSCSTLADREEALNLQWMTGAAAVCGYRKDVDWGESLALEVLLLPSLVRSDTPGHILRALDTKYPDLTSRLGFAWVTPYATGGY